MSHIVDIPFSGGYVSTGTGARDASSLDSGELAKMEAAYYRKNDPTQVWTMPGRTEFGSAGSGAVKGIAICQFDEGGTDKLLASIGTTLVAATPGFTGTFAPLVTGLNSASTKFTACHQDDRWCLGNGYDDNRVLKSDGTLRLMGLVAPTEALTVTSSSVTLVVSRPTSTANGTLPAGVTPGPGWVNRANAIDSSDTTFSSIVGSEGVNDPGLVCYGFASDTSANRYLRVRSSAAIRGNANIVMYVSVDGGVTYSASVMDYNFSYGPEWFTYPITVNSNLVYVKFRTSVAYGYGGALSASVFDVQIKVGSESSSLTTTLGGIYYAFTEFNSTENIESSISKPTLVELSANTTSTITRPTIINPAATHWKVYRTVDGALPTKDNFGDVSGIVSISSSTWVDDYTVGIGTQATPVLNVVSVGDTFYSRDDPPPPFLHMMSWKGSICGISRTDRRKWSYSESGFPESFPPIYTIESFPLDEHDGLVGQMAVGETAIILCQGAVLAVDDLPRMTDGVFNVATARPIKGHPGCVGTYAFTTFSVAGEPRGAWVSPFGVYITNGQVCACISTDLSWEDEVNVPYLGTAVLRWDPKNVILWFEFDLDGYGLNDHEMPFHMAEIHSKGESRPKLGQPTEKATSCMASALIDSGYYRFSGHPSNGKVYVEESGSVDAATGRNVEMIIRSGQVGTGKVDMGVIKATLNHSDFGSGQVGTLTATLYRDSSNSENSRSQSIQIDGNRGTSIGIGRAGELVDFEFTYSGSGVGGVGGVTVEIEGQGRSGSASRWQTSPATP